MEDLAARPTRSLHFTDAVIEQRYRAERALGARRRLRVVMPVLLIFWCVPFWFDLEAPSPMSERNMFIRFVVGLPGFVAFTTFVYVASDRRFLRQWHAWTSAAFALFLGSCVALTAVAVGEFLPHAVIGFLMVLFLGSSLALLEWRALAAISIAAGIAELIVLAMHPVATAFDVRGYATWVAGSAAAILIGGFQLERFQRRVFVQQLAIDRERSRSQDLLHNVMPATIADRLQEHPDALAEHFDGVTVVFADIAGFTGLAARLSPSELVQRLDDIFSRLDDIVQRHGLEKIKTIGDQYMAVAGAPVPRSDHAEAAARVALEICALSRHLGDELTFRVGLASGPAVAGVIGKSRFSYDLWGDTVNLASRMESHGVPGRVQLDRRTRLLLDHGFRFESRGTIEIKGKGPIETYFLLGESDGSQRN